MRPADTRAGARTPSTADRPAGDAARIVAAVRP